jgi:Tripartite tricarboxylate transporter TctB family
VSEPKAVADWRNPYVPDLLAGGLFILLGLAFAVGGSTYDVGSALRMGPGYVPILLGGILAALGLAIVAKAFVGGDQHAREVLDQERGPIPWSQAALLVAAVVFFGATVRGLGLAPALFVATFLAALAGRGTGLVRALVIAAGLTGLCLVVFVGLLQLRLPLLGTWLGG